MSYAILFSVNTECKYNKKSRRLHILFGLFAISPSFFGIYVPPWGKMESLLFKQSEEEVYGSILHGNTIGIHDYTMIWVPDSPIVIDSIQIRTWKRVWHYLSHPGCNKHNYVAPFLMLYFFMRLNVEPLFSLCQQMMKAPGNHDKSWCSARIRLERCRDKPLCIACRISHEPQQVGLSIIRPRTKTYRTRNAGVVA